MLTKKIGEKYDMKKCTPGFELFLSYVEILGEF
jgi:hypothetical protein